MKYHAPTEQFTIAADEMKRASFMLFVAIRHIRKLSDRPLTPHVTSVAMESADFAEQSILDAASALGIDLGASRCGKLDVS